MEARRFITPSRSASASLRAAAAVRPKPTIESRLFAPRGSWRLPSGDGERHVEHPDRRPYDARQPLQRLAALVADVTDQAGAEGERMRRVEHLRWNCVCGEEVAQRGERVDGVPRLPFASGMFDDDVVEDSAERVASVDPLRAERGGRGPRP